MLNITSVFYPTDRLDELKEIPKLLNGEIDYWKCAKLLCKKNGGHLLTLRESATLVEWLYEDDNGNNPKVRVVGYTDLDGYKINSSKAKSIGLKNWNGTDIADGNVLVDLWLGKEYSSNYAYDRYFDTIGTNVCFFDRNNALLQAVCLGD